MALVKDIKVLIQNGALGRLAAGEDYYTGIIFQSSTSPSGWDSSGIERIYSVGQAEDLGLDSTTFPVEHYQISEYFRILDKYNVSAFIDVYFKAIGTGLYDGTEIQELQDYAEGKLRQIGVFLVDALADSFVTDSNTVASSLDSDGFPTSIYLAADIADMSLASDLRALDKKWVSVIAGMDGGGEGFALFTSEGYSVAAIGAALAATAIRKVNENPGWVAFGDVSSGTEYQTIALADGTLLEDVTDAEFDAYDEDGYWLLTKRRVSGAYWYDDPTSAAATSDYAYQKENRTIGKAKRLLLDGLASYQNAPLRVNPSDGTLTEQTIGVFDSAAREALTSMVVEEEIPVDPDTNRLPENTVDIDPDQDVITTNKIVISVKVGATGVAKIIEVPLGFQAS